MPQPSKEGGKDLSARGLQSTQSHDAAASGITEEPSQRYTGQELPTARPRAAGIDVGVQAAPVPHRVPVQAVLLSPAPAAMQVLGQLP